MSEEGLITWLMTTLKESCTGSVVRASEIADRYQNINKASIDLAKLGRLIRRLFPKTSTSHPRNKLTGKQEKTYVNVEFQDDCVQTPFDMGNISLYIPPTCYVKSHLQNGVTIAVPTEFVVNGNVLFKIITFKDSTWNLSIRGKDILLKNIGVDNTFNNTVECFRKTFDIVNKIKVCTGLTITDVNHLYIDINKRSVLMEFISVSGNENTSVTKFRYVNCEQTLKWGSSTEACRTCQKNIKINNMVKKINVLSSQDADIKPTTSCTPPLAANENVTPPATSARGPSASSDIPGQKRGKKIRSSKSKGKSVAKKSRTVKFPCGICEKDCISDATKKNTAVRSKAKRHAVVTKKKKERPDIKSIPGTEFLSEKQKKHVKIHTKSARINVSGKRKRKVIKRLRHQKKDTEEVVEEEDVDMEHKPSSKKETNRKSKTDGMDVDKD